MTLSKHDILSEYGKDNIVINPYRSEQLNNASYDVRLGEYYCRARELEKRASSSGYERTPIFNPFVEGTAENVWEVKKVDSDGLIWLEPGEMILAHTEEFIGSRGDIVGYMQSKSSTARNFISVCRCAGWGDIGYINRWTMEIVNHSPYYRIPLKAGMRIAQIVFSRVETGLDERNHYVQAGGQYQDGTTLEDVMKNWKPDNMICKVWKKS